MPEKKSKLVTIKTQPTGDSRADMQEFAWLAEQFELMHRETDWYDEGYRLAVEAFAIERLEGKMKEDYF